MTGERILIVEDDPHISNVVKLYLTNNGFDVFTAANGTEALQKTEQIDPDLVILDVQLPEMDGMEVCRQIRQDNNVPIIFLSCRAEGTDKIMGLTVGGDDYITKPFDPGELLARIKAHLRRHTRLNTPPEQQNVQLCFPGLIINPATHTVQVNNADVSLSAREFQLLLLLAKQPNVVFGMDEIYQHLWQADSIGDHRTVMVHISNLRKKIEQDSARPKFIMTVKGAGYKFADSSVADKEGSKDA
ncbi:MAG: response regulator transcription factor [Firmicutes bacterium]|nr:response regulator transcription factor [Bacillota bacterium]